MYANLRHNTYFQGNNMALLQVRGCPDDVYDTLNSLAQREHGSVAQQTMILLRSALGEQEQRKARRQELLCALLEEAPMISGDYPSPAELIREDRER